MSLLNMLTDSCTIRRKTETQDTSTGGVEITWADAATGVPCTIQHQKRGGGGEEFLQDREAAVTDFWAYMPPGTDIRFTDRVLGTSGVFNGLTGEVVSDPVDDSGRGAYVRVELRTTRGGGTT